MQRAWREWGTIFVLVLCVFAPSVWMLATLPPLWRDSDGYQQVTGSIVRVAHNGHGLLYSVFARPPLSAGYAIERLLGKTPAAEGKLPAPPLTDTGIFLLLLLQHVALCAVVVTLILASATGFWLRSFLALFFASNALFYSFAQCVGAESLSLSCMLLFVFAGLRLMNKPVPFTRADWLLLLCVLTRHANVFLVLALPLAFVLIALQRRSSLLLRHAAIALGIGLACILLGRLSTEALCRSKGLQYSSKSGFTFIWRLDFLQDMPEARRGALLTDIAARTNSQPAQQVISIMHELLEEGLPLAAETIMPRVQLALGADGREAKKHTVFAALNETLRAFLFPPIAEHWRAAQDEFARARQVTPATVSEFLFLSTAHFFQKPQSMPTASNLITFRNYRAADLLAAPRGSAYLQLWSGVSLERFLLVWGCGVVTLLLTTAWTGGNRSPIMLYGVALVTVGLLLMQLPALLGELSPRFSLPLWEMLWASCLLNAGAISKELVSRRIDDEPPGRKARRAAGELG
jgi:hypothetical protein